MATDIQTLVDRARDAARTARAAADAAQAYADRASN